MPQIPADGASLNRITKVYKSILTLICEDV